MSDTEEQLRKTAAAIRVKLHRIEQEKWLKDNVAKVDTYWKYRNSYSCPQKPSDYWWVYKHITGIPRGAQYFTAFIFQVDRSGKITVENDRFSSMSGWQPCSAREYRAAWRRVVEKIKKAKP